MDGPDGATTQKKSCTTTQKATSLSLFPITAFLFHFQLCRIQAFQIWRTQCDVLFLNKQAGPGDRGFDCGKRGDSIWAAKYVSGGVVVLRHTITTASCRGVRLALLCVRLSFRAAKGQTHLPPLVSDLGV